MSPSLVTCLCVIGILCLVYLNRDLSVRTSRALWIPVVWFWILGSRPVSSWFGGPSGTLSVEQIDDGSPTDAAVTLALMVIGLAVLISRGRKPLSLLSANWPIILYFSYGLISVVWSDFPGIAIKRWVKATGDVIMALVVLTDNQPVAALRRLFSRLGFVLLPVSELFIRYYPSLGRGFDQWGGAPTNTGVTINKNLLGPVVFVLTLGAAWQVLRLWRGSTVPDRSRQLMAQCVLLGMGIWLLHEAHSATSGTCFTLSAGLLLLTNLPRIRGRARAVQGLVLTVVLVGGLVKVTGFGDTVVEVIGRNPDLTGRADFWPLLLPMQPNVLVGSGFESFWTGPRMHQIWMMFPNAYINESHNGYIEVYLNLGLIGLGLIVAMFIHSYRQSLAALRTNPDLGSLILAYILTAAVYSYTEAGFRMLFFPWSFLILAMLAVSASSRNGGFAEARRLSIAAVPNHFNSGESVGFQNKDFFRG